MVSKTDTADVLKSVSDGIDDVIYISDPDTYELLHVNETCRRIWGADIVGKKCYRVLQNRDVPCPFCTNEIIFGPCLGKSYVWEFQNEVNGHWYRCSDKAIKWHDGRLVRFELAADITELKRTEQQLKQAVDKLAQSNEDLQQFAYVASHDLQEPLRMVSSFTQLLAERYAGQLDDKAIKWIHFAVDGANRMQKLIQDLLTFSRVNTHGRKFSPIDVENVVEQVLESLQLKIRETGAKITIGSLPRVTADETQIAQLFLNLIGNALKFSRDTRPEIHVSGTAEGDEWVFSVRDNGIGIAPEFLDKIFVIFQRLHTIDEFPGTGLGLAVCKRIVQRHGGRIWAESCPDEGAVFHFSLSRRHNKEARQ